MTEKKRYYDLDTLHTKLLNEAYDLIAYALDEVMSDEEVLEEYRELFPKLRTLREEYFELQHKLEQEKED